MPFDLVLYSSPTFDTSTGKFSGALNGGYGVPATPVLSGLPFAVGVWFKMLSAPVSGDTPRIIVGQANAFWIGYKSDGLMYFDFGNENLLVTTALSSLNVWHFATISVSPTTLTATLDGVVVGTQPVGATTATYTRGDGGSTTGYFAVRDYGGFNSSGNYRFPGEVDEVSVWSIDKYNGAFTPPAAPYTGSETGLLALYHLDGDGSDSAGSQGQGQGQQVGSTTTIVPNNSAILYSPGNWLVGSGSAKTIYSGAYLKTLFTGTSCALTFNLAANSTPYPQIWYNIDDTTWVQATIGATVTLTMPTTTTTWNRHTLEVVVKSASNWLNIAGSAGGSRWSPQNTAMVFTGLVLDAGAAVALPPVYPLKVMINGDSITEGYHTRTNAGSGQQDTDGSDARVGWAYNLRHTLGAEVATFGLGGTGLTITASLGVPPFGQTWNLLWAGQARTYGAPDLIINAYGENDGTSVGDATFITGYKAALAGQLAATPSSTLIACMIPFSQRKIQDITTVVAQMANPRVRLIQTAGMFNPADSVDGVHPLGLSSASILAPAVGAKIAALLRGVPNQWVHS